MVKCYQGLPATLHDLVVAVIGRAQNTNKKDSKIVNGGKNMEYVKHNCTIPCDKCYPPAGEVGKFKIKK